jgi:putative flippase GtrA
MTITAPTTPASATSASAPPAEATSGPGLQGPDVEIVVPVYNEEAELEASIRRLHRYLTERFPLTWQLTIADNASRDRTWDIACRLAGLLPGVQAIHLDQKGRGRALRAAWATSTAAVVAYMDVDLATDLNALLPLVAPLVSGHSDVAVGTRLAPGARVARGPKRELISRTYNLLLKATLHNGFSDAQCGFKAVRAGVARALLPLVEDDGWFFDTELLVLAEHNGLRIHEVPVDWTDDPDSRVDVATTARDDLKGIWRMWRRFAAGEGVLAPDAARPSTLDAPRPSTLAGQLVRFAEIGAVSTAVFAVLFLLLAGPLGPVAADVVALGTCGAANLAANRRITFGLRRTRRGRAVAASPLVLNLAALAVLGRAGVAGAAADLLALTAVNAAVAVGRFGLLRHWVFPRVRAA